MSQAMADQGPSARLYSDLSASLPTSATELGGLSRPELQPPLTSRKEAQYFMHYIQNLSSWVDTNDLDNHFRTEVPRRALHLPLLAYSILAFSSRHLSFCLKKEDPNCTKYYSSAIQLLIPMLDDAITAHTEDTLAAIVLLRLYEEMTDVDSATHLSGSSLLLNSISDLATGGGLGEAASWIVLRQDIYVSLKTSKPLSIQLDSYRGSASFARDDAGSIANQAVFLCGRALRYAFRPSARLDVREWEQLSEDVEKWYESKPRDFRSYYMEDPMTMDPAARSSAFPTLWMSRPAYISGYQYYYLSRIILAIFDPRLWIPNFDAFKRRREAEAAVLRNLRLVVGLAIKHPSVSNGGFTAHHALLACGSYLRDAREQFEAIQFLEHIEATTGWPTAKLVRNLRIQWSLHQKESPLESDVI
ncbi:hypothetical protein F4775DRAFT_127590 [Biscogniauxia sp. FL1348]|nr:hypothetical protein F4775DRAFT_127590 [Biscogniauxia sp. FL1348]